MCIGVSPQKLFLAVVALSPGVRRLILFQVLIGIGMIMWKINMQVLMLRQYANKTFIRPDYGVVVQLCLSLELLDHKAYPKTQTLSNMSGPPTD